MKRQGTADLPLHQGRVPRWLSDRMARLGVAITQAIVENEGTKGFLQRLSNPLWFQALGTVMGMDWHSSGITTSVMGALKKGLTPRAGELGLAICGGRGRYSKRVPDELLDWSSRYGLDGTELVRSSRLSAKVDNGCVQDGFSIYLHAFAVDAEGRWSVVQQGMSPQRGLARRYHWSSSQLQSFVDDPHAGIVGTHEGLLVNLADHQALPARESILDFSAQDPAKQLTELRQVMASRPISSGFQNDLKTPAQGEHVTLPQRHDIRPQDIDAGRLGAVLALAWELQPPDFEDLLLLEGLGPRTLQSLALVSEVVYGKPSRFTDPARFAFAHGGKDGHPFPVPLEVYDRTISTLETALNRSSGIDHSEKRAAFQRLHHAARQLEIQSAPQANVDAAMERERQLSPQWGGRSIFGPAGVPIPDQNAHDSKQDSSQLSLFDQE